MQTYQETTRDNGPQKHCTASDNAATYVLTSAYAHDLHDGYLQRYHRAPSSRWYNKHFSFTRIK